MEAQSSSHQDDAGDQRGQIGILDEGHGDVRLWPDGDDGQLARMGTNGLDDEVGATVSTLATYDIFCQ